MYGIYNDHVYTSEWFWSLFSLWISSNTYYVHCTTTSVNRCLALSRVTLVSGMINVVRIVLYFKHVHYDFFETSGHGSPALRATYLQNISSLTLLAHVQQKLDLQQIGWKMSNISKRILAPEIMSSNGINLPIPSAQCACVVNISGYRLQMATRSVPCDLG